MFSSRAATKESVTKPGIFVLGRATNDEDAVLLTTRSRLRYVGFDETGDSPVQLVSPSMYAARSKGLAGARNVNGPRGSSRRCDGMVDLMRKVALRNKPFSSLKSESSASNELTENGSAALTSLEQYAADKQGSRYPSPRLSGTCPVPDVSELVGVPRCIVFLAPDPGISGASLASFEVAVTL